MHFNKLLLAGIASILATLTPLDSVSAENIAADAWSIRPLLPGSPAPAFEAIAADGSRFEFNPETRDRPAIVVFYRGGWCPYCNLHFAELRAIEEELLALNMDLIFLSADSPETLAEALDEPGELNYHLLSDNTTTIAQAFGIAWQLDDALIQRYAEHGHDLEAAAGQDHHVLPVPAVFIIANARIEFSYVNPDYKVRLHPEVLLAAARTMPGRELSR